MNRLMHYPATISRVFCRYLQVQPQHQLTFPAKHWHCWWGNSQTGHHLDITVYRHELAQSTHCTYASRKRHYLNFCGRLGVPTLPASKGQLCYFVGFLNNQVLLHQTVKSCLSEVCYLQISQGKGDPKMGTMPRLEMVIQGLRRSKRAYLKNQAPDQSGTS